MLYIHSLSRLVRILNPRLSLIESGLYYTQAEALCVKQQLEEDLDVAKLAVAALNVDWSKFVDKGVHALPLAKKTKKAAAARAKKIAAAAAAEAAAAAAVVATDIEDDMHATASATSVEHSTAGSAGDGAAPASPDPLASAISGVIANGAMS